MRLYTRTNGKPYCKYVNNKSRLGWFSSEYFYCKFSNYTKVEI